MAVFSRDCDDRTGGSNTTLQPPSLGAGSGPHRSPMRLPRTCCLCRTPTKFRTGTIGELSAPPEIENDGCRYNWDNTDLVGARPDRKAQVAFFEPGHHAISGGKSVGATAR